MINEDILAPGWTWSARHSQRKVLQPKGSRIRVEDRTFVYKPGRNTGQHGDWVMEHNGSLPVLKLALLTYYEDEILAHVDERLKST